MLTSPVCVNEAEMFLFLMIIICMAHAKRDSLQD